MGARRIRRMQRQVDMAQSRRCNGLRKAKERTRRDARMIAILKNGSLPYLPAVMSWLSQKTNKASSRITKEDVDKLLT